MPVPPNAPTAFIHGSKMQRKAASDASLGEAARLYGEWKNSSLRVNGRTPKDIHKLTDLLNIYKGAVEPILDHRPNSAQEVLQPSILEEFFEYLFCRIKDEVGSEVLREPASGYIGLSFNPSSLEALMTKPEYTVRQKDHDFVIGASIELSIKAVGETTALAEKIIVPAIAIECKRYLERNMLDECAGTAEKIKRATPYCKYIVVAEYLKMDDASPEISLIDEIFVLRKQRNSERLGAEFKPNPIDASLVCEIYSDCVRHLGKIWWDPQSALKTGKVFNLPR